MFFTLFLKSKVNESQNIIDHIFLLLEMNDYSNLGFVAPMLKHFDAFSMDFKTVSRLLILNGFISFSYHINMLNIMTLQFIS